MDVWTLSCNAYCCIQCNAVRFSVIQCNVNVQATQSEGRAVERAAAWCSMIGVPYFRFSPQLSEDVALDCKDDATLINMLWETRCYITDHVDHLVQLVSLLGP